MLRDALWFVAGLIGGALTTELVGWFKSSGDRRFAAFRSAWSNPRRFGMAMAVLGELYGSSHDMLRLGATAYPCVAWATRGDDVEAILRRPLLELATDAPLAASAEYRMMVDSRMKTSGGKGLYNGDIYLMRGVSVDTDVRLACSPGFGAYFGMLDTCEALEYELLSSVPSWIPDNRWARRRVRGVVVRRLKLRNRLHARVSDPVTDGSGRNAGVGGSTVTVYLEDGDYRILVPKRADGAVAGQKGLHAVVPTFIMEAARGAIDEEFSVGRNVRREYVEELLGRDRINRVGPRSDRTDELDRMLKSGAARLRPLGVAVNLLNLRPDVCSLLVIEDESWIDSVSLSSEFSQEGQRRGSLTVAEHLSALDNEGRLLFAPHEIAPACAGALWLALNHPEVRALTRGTH